MYIHIFAYVFKNGRVALTGVARSVGHCPTMREVAGLIPVRVQAWVVGLVPGFEVLMRGN